METLFLDFFSIICENCYWVPKQAVCEKHVLHLVRKRESLYTSLKLRIFCKLEMQVISMERRGKENTYYYFCYRYPQELGVFKAIFLVILPSHSQCDNLVKCKSFFFIFAGFKARGQTVFLNYALGLEICTKTFQNCLVEF